MSQGTRAGALNRLITVQQRSQAQDSTGAQAFTWATLKPVYAGMRALSAAEITKLAGIFTDVSHAFTVRYDDIFADPTVTATYRFLYQATPSVQRIFDVKGSMNQDEDNRVMEIVADEGVTQG